MGRSRASAISSRASDIVDGIRKQMGLYTPPPLPVPRTPLIESRPSNVINSIPVHEVVALPSTPFTPMAVDESMGTTQVDHGSTMTIDVDMDMDMDWEPEQSSQISVDVIDEHMLEEGKDIDGDVIMGEPDYVQHESPEIEMAILPSTDLLPVFHIPQTVSASTPTLTFRSFDTASSLAIASPLGPSLALFDRKGKGTERLFPSPPLNDAKEGSSSMMPFQRPAPRIKSATVEDVPDSPRGRPRSSSAGPSKRPQARDDDVPYLNLEKQ